MEFWEQWPYRYNSWAKIDYLKCSISAITLHCECPLIESAAYTKSCLNSKLV